MELVSFSVECSTGPHQRVGIFEDEKVIDVNETFTAVLDQEGHPEPRQVANTVAPPSMIEFLRLGEQALDAARQSLPDNNAIPSQVDGRQTRYDRSDVKLLSPLVRPNSIKDCTVYEEHLLNTRDIKQGSLPDAYYEFPVYYKGNPDAVVHPGETVQWPEYTDKLDFELEIAAVIGKQGRNISAEDATEYIAGFTIFNDFSARDVQSEAKPVKMGPSKSKDFANGFGPSIVTADSIDPTNLQTTVRVNDEVWSEGTTDGMYHSWGEILEHVSEGITIHPGDVIGSGTIPGGCGLEMDRWIQLGDTIKLTIDGIGTLRHTVGQGD